MGSSLYLWLFFQTLLLVSALEEETYSDTFIMKTNLSESEVRTLAAKDGFELKKKVLDGYFLLKRREGLPRMSKKPTRLPANSTLKRHPMNRERVNCLQRRVDIAELSRKRVDLYDKQIEQFEQEVYLKRYITQGTESTAIPVTSTGTEQNVTYDLVINDDHWRDMWYMHKTQKPNMGIYEAWSRGYTGSGVTVAFVDDGIQANHSDLTNNFLPDLSYNYLYNTHNPAHAVRDSGHGTRCAGVVSAEKNNLCVLGVAYNSKFAALKFIDYGERLTPSVEAMSLTHKLNRIDIYSNSWGPRIGDGASFGGPNYMVKQALRTGISQGRNGKGAIYVFACGNGNDMKDDCNTNGFANSIYTVAIGSLSNTLKPAHYSEPCTAVMATTYGGERDKPSIATTMTQDTCITTFSGTSAAAPMATGIIALTLEANPELTWRDVMHLIVETSCNDGLRDPEEGFIVNGAGKKVCRYTGFGLMNAERMITRALRWATVPSVIVGFNKDYTPRSGNSSVHRRLRIDGPIKYLEHVKVWVNYKVNIRGHAEFHLTSPNGTRCKLLGSRYLDDTSMPRPYNFTFSSVHTWGEDPGGWWELEMTASGHSEEVEIGGWDLTVYGTLTHPLEGTPEAGSYGGECLPDNSCRESDHCCDEVIDKCTSRYNSNCKQGRTTSTIVTTSSSSNPRGPTTSTVAAGSSSDTLPSSNSPVPIAGSVTTVANHQDANAAPITRLSVLYCVFIITSSLWAWV